MRKVFGLLLTLVAGVVLVLLPAGAAAAGAAAAESPTHSPSYQCPYC
jgi:hypothetical protein